AVSLEGWVDQMYLIEDTPGNSVIAVIFYVTMVAFGGLFVVQLFLAIIFDNFIRNESGEANAQLNEWDSNEAIVAAERAHEEAALEGAQVRLESVSDLSESSLATLQEKSYISLNSNTNRSSGSRGLTNMRAAVREVALQRHASSAIKGGSLSHKHLFSRAAVNDKNSLFNRAMLGLIVLNTFTMTLPTYSDSTLKGLLLELFNVLFVFAFVAEAVVRVRALGWAAYIEDK
ncbi:MAG: hypothetical protein SGPRY_012485, partial [Prymnesium sp.]